MRERLKELKTRHQEKVNDLERAKAHLNEVQRNTRKRARGGGKRKFLLCPRIKLVLTSFREEQVKNAQTVVKDLKTELQASLEDIVNLDERLNTLRANTRLPSDHTSNTDGPSVEVGVEERTASTTNTVGEQHIENGPIISELAGGGVQNGAPGADELQSGSETAGIVEPNVEVGVEPETALVENVGESLVMKKILKVPNEYTRRTSRNASESTSKPRTYTS